MAQHVYMTVPTVPPGGESLEKGFSWCSNMHLTLIRSLISKMTRFLGSYGKMSCESNLKQKRREEGKLKRRVEVEVVWEWEMTLVTQEETERQLRWVIPIFILPHVPVEKNHSQTDMFYISCFISSDQKMESKHCPFFMTSPQRKTNQTLLHTATTNMTLGD